MSLTLGLSLWHSGGQQLNACVSSHTDPTIAYMAVRTIYLDQNKWIALARAHHNRPGSEHLRPVLVHLEAAVRSGAVIVPLSAVHYMETWRHADAERRRRLGDFMTVLSEGYTIAPWRSILLHEVSAALSKWLPAVKVVPLEYIGRGIAHAFGESVPNPEFSAENRGRMRPDLERRLQDFIRHQLERSAISGVGPASVPPAPPFQLTSHNKRFHDHLTRLPETLAQLPPSKRDDALYAISLMDIAEILKEVLNLSSLSWDSLATLDAAKLKSLVDDLPSRRADLHLHRQVVRNPSLRVRLTDLEDWAGLGPAVAYCDVVVCEKHFASMMHRDGFQTHACVITNLQELPAMLQ